MNAAAQLTFAHPTAEHVTEVRALVRKVAKQHGQKVHVRKGAGSCKDAVIVCANPSAQEGTALRIAVCEALLAAGYEHVHAVHGHDLAGHFIRLAREWDHQLVSLMVAKRIVN